MTSASCFSIHGDVILTKNWDGGVRVVRLLMLVIVVLLGYIFLFKKIFKWPPKCQRTIESPTDGK